MAFPQYGGYPYNGYPAYPPPTNYPQPMPAIQTPPGGPELVTVQTINQVEQVGVQPGQRRIVMVQNEPVIAARSADQMGLVSTEYYRLEKFDPAASAVTPQTEYITRREFDEFVAGLKTKTKKEDKTE